MVATSIDPYSPMMGQRSLGSLGMIHQCAGGKYEEAVHIEARIVVGAE